MVITINGTKRYLELIYFMHKANVQKVDMDGNYAQQDQPRVVTWLCLQGQHWREGVKKDDRHGAQYMRKANMFDMCCDPRVTVQDLRLNI